jgi:hypothetical protein
MIGPSETEDEVVFADEKTQEYQDLIESQLKFDKTFTEQDDEEINVDDI